MSLHVVLNIMQQSNHSTPCLQLLFHPLDPSDVKRINQQQMKGGTPDPNLIQDAEIRRLTERFNLMEEMFGNKAAGQVEANKQVCPCSCFCLYLTKKQKCSRPVAHHHAGLLMLLFLFTVNNKVSKQQEHDAAGQVEVNMQGRSCSCFSSWSLIKCDSK